jgi:hypothetical protein
MTDNDLPPARQTITRTLTMTTVETWTITIRLGEDSQAAGEVVIDPNAEETKSIDSEEEK